jgi:hypothetical protein
LFKISCNNIILKVVTFLFALPSPGTVGAKTASFKRNILKIMRNNWRNVSFNVSLIDLLASYCNCSGGKGRGEDKTFLNYYMKS